MIVLTGTYTADCAVLALANDDVQRMLLPGYRLAAQNIAPPGSHPVILMMGNQTRVRFTACPCLAPLQYHEVTLAVPWVESRLRPAEVMAHPSRLWLDKWLPVIGGRLLGFPKRLSRMDIDATGYAARSFLFGIPIFSAHYGLTGEPGRPASFANYAAIAPIFEQPFVQQMLCLYPTVSLAMQWLMADATMQALNMTLDVHGGADPGIPPGTYQVEGIDQQVLGGFRLTVNWRMPSPKLMR